MEDFEKIWSIFPRKVAKHPAFQEWLKMPEGDRFAAAHALPVHIRFWQACAWDVTFIPHLRTWLHQKRWMDELEIPQGRRSTDDWMRTTAGIAAKAKELGIEPKMGEDWHSLKTRILARAC